MSKLIKCKACGNNVAKGAKKCPNCGKDNRTFFAKHKILTAIGILIILVAISKLGAEKPADSNDSTIATTNNTESNSTPKPEEKPAVSTEFKNALSKAKSYSDMMHMSKSGIYEQLTSEHGEKFPADAAQYAIDNLQADYKNNALEKAKSYQTQMNMSKSAVYDQLVSDAGEKFTPEEAQYAVDNLK